jgi:hypothetical protein
VRPFPVGQIDEMTWRDRLSHAWRDLRFARKHGVLNVMPPGHYHSPVPALDEVPEELFTAREHDIPGIDLRVPAQLALAATLAPYAAEIPFRRETVEGLRYRLSNPFFYESDGLIYYSLLRYWKPQRIVEVGSGFSTALALDTADLYEDVSPLITAIDPNPGRLRSLVRPGDRLEIVEERVQTVDASVFEQLEAGDILFIDSSHVTKIGSDVNRLFLEIVPRLPTGVRVHVHDIFYPEYPRQFVHGGMHWNEAYLVRALLTGSNTLRMIWWNAYLQAAHHEEVAKLLPGWGQPACSSLWIETV